MRYSILLLVLALGLSAMTLSGKDAFHYRPTMPHALRHTSCKVSPRILWGTAVVESDITPSAISKDGQDRGAWQFRKKYDKARGIVNPFDIVESARHAEDLLYACFAKHKTTLTALASYRQGDTGLKRDGVSSRSRRYCREAIAAFK